MSCKFNDIELFLPLLFVWLYHTSYELMLKCWSLDPDERPTPIDIVATLTPLDGPSLPDSSDVSEVREEDCKTNGVTPNGNTYNQ